MAILKTLSRLCASKAFWNYYMACFILITAAQEVLNIAPFIYLRMAMVVAGLILADEKNLHALYIFFILFSSENTLYTVNVIFSGMLLVRSGRFITLKTSLKLTILLIIWELIHVFSYYLFPFEMDYFVKIAGFSLVMFANMVFVSQIDIKQDFPRLMHIFVFSTIASCVIFYINYIQYLGPQAAFSFSAGIGRLSPGINDFKKNPNLVSRCCGFSLALTTIYAMLTWKRMTKQKRLFYIGILVLIIFFGMLSGSLSFYLSVGVTILCILFAVFHDYRIQNALALCGGAVLALAAGVLAVFQFAPSAVRRIIYDLNSDDASSGRLGLWVSYAELFIDNLWLLFGGIGLQDYFRKLTIMAGIEELEPAHNIVIEVIASWGLVGLLGYVLLFWILLREKDISQRQSCYLAKVPAIVILIISFTGNVFYGYYTNLIFIVLAITSICYFTACYKNRNATPIEAEGGNGDA